MKRRWGPLFGLLVLMQVMPVIPAVPARADEAIAYFDGQAPSDRRLSVMGPHGEDRTNIVGATGYDPAWAPGGGRLVYSGLGGVFSEVGYTPLSGGCESNVPVGGAYSASWTPDGTHLVFGQDPGSFSDRSGPNVVQLYDTLTGALTSLGGGYWPVLSPDGKAIAFTDAGATALMMMDADGSHRRPLPVSVEAGRGFGWSPDSQRVAFVTADNGQDVVVSVRAADGSGLVRIATGSHAEHPSFSPDGAHVYFSDGTIFVASADGSGSQRQVSPAGTADARPTSGNRGNPAADGYWMVGATDSRIFDFGNTCARTTSQHGPLRAPVVGAAAERGGQGLWVVTSDGSVLSAGTRNFYGSMGDQRLNRPVVGMAATPSGNGYWLVASDGGIFSFGDAAFYGSTGGIRLNKPVVGMAATPSGNGYWLVASDGGIFTFGDAAFYGSAGAVPLNQPIIGMAAAGDGAGYWLVATDGGVFTYGDAPYMGAIGRPIGQPIAALVRHA